MCQKLSTFQWYYFRGGLPFYSPYINQFLSADTIVPGYANPQNLNRYSYVTNNPLRYTDPTGHRPEDGYAGNHGSLDCRKHSQYCSNGKPKSQKELKAMRKKTERVSKPLQTSSNISLGLALGAPPPVQDYYGDYENNTNVPYFPGGNTQPNPCVGGGAAVAACFVSLFVGVVAQSGGSTTPANNFFLSFILTFGEDGIAMSDVQWSNQYSEKAVFSDLQVNNRSFRVEGGSYMPRDGVYRPIPGSGAYSTSGELSIQASVYTLINTSNGPGVWPYKLTYTYP